MGVDKCGPEQPPTNACGAVVVTSCYLSRRTKVRWALGYLHIEKSFTFFFCLQVFILTNNTHIFRSHQSPRFLCTIYRDWRRLDGFQPSCIWKNHHSLPLRIFSFVLFYSVTSVTPYYLPLLTRKIRCRRLFLRRQPFWGHDSAVQPIYGMWLFIV